MKIVSGGQTGVDRGALDAAMECGMQTGGWCPAGRRAEDGVIPSDYKVFELADDKYEARTERNVVDSEATLIICRGELSGGTLYTKKMAVQHERPFLVVNPDEAVAAARTNDWLIRVAPAILNVAGPRESKDPGIQDATREWLRRLWCRGSS